MFNPNHRLRGDFISAVQELIPVSVIQPHQIEAAMHPEKPTKTLAAKRKPVGRPSERRVDDPLSRKAS